MAVRTDEGMKAIHGEVAEGFFLPTTIFTDLESMNVCLTSGQVTRLKRLVSFEHGKMRKGKENDQDAIATVESICEDVEERISMMIGQLQQNVASLEFAWRQLRQVRGFAEGLKERPLGDDGELDPFIGKTGD